MALTAAALKRSIEAELANRVPSALSPVPRGTPRLQPTADQTINALLGGGFPLGSLCEVTGPESSGRSSVALALLANACQQSACAYIDVSDALSPHSAAASGVLLRNLLWVRFRSEQRKHPHFVSLPRQASAYQQPTQQHGSSQHPHRETEGLSSELERMLLHKQERRRRKMEGTPGYPNQPVGLSEAPLDQVEWEQFNSRKADDKDPLRQLDRAAAEAARQQAAVVPARSLPTQPTNSWILLDRGLRATDQVLQAGGFRVVVLDLASTPPELSQRIQSSTWWRYHKAAKQSDAILMVLSQSPCARSSAAYVLECASGSSPKIQGVLTSVQHTIKVTRQRTNSSHGEKVPCRITSWTVAPAWMRAVGR